MPVSIGEVVADVEPEGQQAEAPASRQAEAPSPQAALRQYRVMKYRTEARAERLRAD